MAMSNAERQRNYIARLKSLARQARPPDDDEAITPEAAFSGLPTTLIGGEDIVARKFVAWFEQQILEGKMKPLTVDIIGNNLQYCAHKYRVGFDKARRRARK